MKHTSGPWHVGMRNGQNINMIYAYDGKDQHFDTSVAAVFGLPMHARIEDIPERMQQGLRNAQLIACAPDLLEALQAAVDCGMVPVSSAAKGGAAKYSKQVMVADMIRTAIAKATGEPS